MSQLRSICVLATASVVAGTGCLEAPGPFMPRDSGEDVAEGGDVEVVDERNPGLVVTDGEFAREVRGKDFEIGFEAGTGWGLSSLRVVTDDLPSAEILYRGTDADERWAGALLYDPNDNSNAFHASWESEGDRRDPIERGAALVHFQYDWVAEGSDYTGTTDVVTHADGRVHVHHRTELVGDALEDAWLLSYFAFDLDVIEHISLELSDERAVPSTPAINRNSFSILFREEPSAGRHPSFLCAYGRAGEANTPVAVGVADLSGTPPLLSRFTEGSEEANVSHSIRMQFDWARGLVTPGEYRGSFALVALPEADCRGRVSALLDHGIRPAELIITHGGTVVRDDPRDAAGDGFIEGLGYYEVRLASGGVGDDARRLAFAFSTGSNATTLRLDAAVPFDNLDTLQVLRENDPLTPGVHYLAQRSQGGGRVFIVFLRSVQSDSSYEIKW